MKPDDWKRIKHFPECEARHEDDGWEHIELDTMLRLDAMRHEDGEPDGWVFIVLEAFRYPKPGARHSFHGFKANGGLRGMAIDGVMVDRATRRPLPLLRQWAIAERWGWGGIGLYPFWMKEVERDGRLVEVPFGGLHLDDRPYSHFDRHPRWWRDAAGNYRGLYEFLELSGLWPAVGGAESSLGCRLDLTEQEAATLERFISRQLPDLDKRIEVAHLEQTLEKLREARVGL